MKLFKSFAFYFLMVIAGVGLGKWVAGVGHLEPVVESTCDEPEGEKEGRE